MARKEKTETVDEAPAVDNGQTADIDRIINSPDPVAEFAQVAAASPFGQRPRKKAKRTTFFLVLAQQLQSSVEDVAFSGRSARGCRKWLEENRGSLKRFYSGARIIRCKPVPD